MHPLLRSASVPALVLALSATAGPAPAQTADPVQVRREALGPVPQEKLDRFDAERELVPREVEVELPALPPQPDALGCGAPCLFGTLSATHPFYDVFLNCGGGMFTAGTGTSHSVTRAARGRQNVIYGGAGGAPGTSDVSWRFHDQNLTYQNPTGGAACAFNPPDTPSEPANVGLEQEWTVSPAPGITCVLRQEIVAFGSVEDDSGVRLTLSTTNLASSTSSVNVGVRWQIDYQNAGDDGPYFATVTCDPPTVVREWRSEHELTPAEIRDFYRIQNNTGTPIFANLSSTAAILGFPDTGVPDRLVFGYWPSLSGSQWDYATNEGSTAVDSDSAVLYYHGYLPADGDVIAPGQTRRHSFVIFSSVERVECGMFVPTCASSVSAPPADRTICRGDSTTLDGSGATLTDCSGAGVYTWSDGTSTWNGAIQSVTPDATTTYTMTLQCSTDPDCEATLDVTVRVEEPPQFEPPLAVDPDACNGGIKLAWNAARFLGPAGTGTYSVYRSDVSCADALGRAPIAARLASTTWWDPDTVPGRTYHYVVEAEDSSPAAACAPVGPGGGTVTRLCAPSVQDGTEVTVPDGVFHVLFMRKSAPSSIVADWSTSRALLPGEHFHLLKAWDAPTRFRHANGEGSVATTFSETDASSWLQFFDVRVASACEALSAPDYPPGWDGHR